MTTWLTPHFSLEELSATSHRRIDNTPPAEVAAELARTAVRMEQVRALLGDQVVSVSSGYRSPKLNRKVGGAPRSAHLKGYAVDFTCRRFGPPLEVCRAIAGSSLAFDQLIEEGSWVHISFAPAMRREVLTRGPGGTYMRGLRKDGAGE